MRRAGEAGEGARLPLRVALRTGRRAAAAGVRVRGPRGGRGRAEAGRRRARGPCEAGARGGPAADRRGPGRGGGRRAGRAGTPKEGHPARAARDPASPPPRENHPFFLGGPDGGGGGGCRRGGARGGGGVTGIQSWSGQPRRARASRSAGVIATRHVVWSVVSTSWNRSPLGAMSALIGPRTSRSRVSGDPSIFGVKRYRAPSIVNPTVTGPSGDAHASTMSVGRNA